MPVRTRKPALAGTGAFWDCYAVVISKKSDVRRKLRLLKFLGPGLITGASDDDPSGIGTYSQAGAQLGYGIAWTMLFTYPLMAAIQELSARVGRVTGHGLAGNICRHYPGWLLQTMAFALFIANAVNIGADLGAMADATRLLIGGPGEVYVLLLGVSPFLKQPEHSTPGAIDTFPFGGNGRHPSRLLVARAA